MILLLDAYNILNYNNKKLHNDDEIVRFVTRIHRYARAKKLSAILVFDGIREINYPLKVYPGTQDEQIQIFFSGYKKTADDRIIEYIQEHPQSNILVVSNDRDLANSTMDFGAHIMSVEAFLDCLSIFEKSHVKKQKHTQQQDQKAHKAPWSYSNQELDKLMEEYSQHIPDKDYKDMQNYINKKRDKSNKKSKKEKLAEKIVKKL
jgi:predicted RNA-binding protein with PIN domain